MIYIMLDTNIILDMFVDRKDSNVKNGFSQKFLQLMDTGHITLVVPQIVKVETYRHIDKEIDAIGNAFKEMDAALRKLHCVVGFDGTELNVIAEKEIGENLYKDSLENFQEKRNLFVERIRYNLKSLFNHSQCIVVKETPKMLENVLRRKIYKRAPMHKESKESYADALITETLLEMKKIKEITIYDRIYFVTRNTSDFSAKGEDKRVLHPDIIEDLKDENIYEQFKYITSLNELVGKELKTDLKDSILVEDMEKTLRRDILTERRNEIGLFSNNFNNSVMDETTEKRYLESDFYNELQQKKEVFMEIQDKIDQIKDKLIKCEEKYLELSYDKYNEILNQLNEENVTKADSKKISTVFECKEIIDQKINAFKGIKVYEFSDDTGYYFIEYFYTPTGERNCFYITNMNKMESDRLNMILEGEDCEYEGFIEIRPYVDDSDDDEVIDDYYAHNSVYVFGDDIIDALEIIIKEWEEWICKIKKEMQPFFEAFCIA